MKLNDLIVKLYTGIDELSYVSFNLINKKTARKTRRTCTIADLVKEMESEAESSNFELYLPTLDNENSKIKESQMILLPAFFFTLPKGKDFDPMMISQSERAITDDNFDPSDCYFVDNGYNPSMVFDYPDSIAVLTRWQSPINLSDSRSRAKLKDFLNTGFLPYALDAAVIASEFRGRKQGKEIFPKDFWRKTNIEYTTPLRINVDDDSNVALLVDNSFLSYRFEDLKKAVRDRTIYHDPDEKAESDSDILKQGTIGKVFFTVPENVKDIRIPADYALSKNGVYSITKDKFICNTPIFISKRIQEGFNFDSLGYDRGEWKYEVMFLQGSTWRKALVSAKDLLDAGVITQIIASRGGYVDSTQGRELVKYFNASLKSSGESMPQGILFKKTGWHSSTFILPNSNSSDIVDSGAYSSFIKQKGDPQSLINLIKKSWKYSSCRLMIDCTLASPLLHLVDCRNFTVALISQTQTGKTAAQRLGNALIASREGLGKLNATTNSLEMQAAERNDITFHLNEWQLVDQRYRATVANSLVHRHELGESKNRLNKNSQQMEIKYFRNIMTMSAEEPITSNSSIGGVYSRLLEIHLPCAIGKFDYVQNIPIVDTQLTEEIYKVTEKNYGSIFPIFVQKLIDFDKDKLVETFEDFKKRCVEFDKNKSQYSHITFVSILCLADYLFSMWWLGKSDRDAFDDALGFAMELLTHVPLKKNILDSARAATAFQSWVGENQKFFIDLDNFDRELPIPNKVFGYWKGKELYLFPTSLDNALTELGFSPGKIKAEWAIEHKISYDSRSHRYVKKISDQDGNRLYVVKTFVNRFDDDDDDKPIDPDQNPTPPPDPKYRYHDHNPAEDSCLPGENIPRDPISYDDNSLNNPYRDDAVQNFVKSDEDPEPIPFDNDEDDEDTLDELPEDDEIMQFDQPPIDHIVKRFNDPVQRVEVDNPIQGSTYIERIIIKSEEEGDQWLEKIDRQLNDVTYRLKRDPNNVELQHLKEACHKQMGSIVDQMVVIQDERLQKEYQQRMDEAVQKKRELIQAAEQYRKDHPQLFDS